jgi:hypothetical protein
MRAASIELMFISCSDEIGFALAHRSYTRKRSKLDRRSIKITMTVT